MTGLSMDLEDCNDLLKGVVNYLHTEELDINSFLNPDFRKPFPSLPFQDLHKDSFNIFSRGSYDADYEPIDYINHIKQEFDDFNMPLLEPLDPFPAIKRELELPMYGNSSHSDMEPEYHLIVSPNSILPVQKEDLFDSIWPEISDLNDEKLVEMVDNGILDDNYVSLDDIQRKKKSKKLAYLDYDHCYSQRLPVEGEDDDDDDDDYFNSSLYSPASSSCSDPLVASRGTKRVLPKRKTTRRKKIKQEMSSDDEEVDVETPCSVPLVVPKITIAISPPPVQPAKRGRKPKNKSEGQPTKKSNKNCAVSPKVLQAAIKQQAKKSYITKSGRVSKISNSVETSPSTSTLSSLNNSRCNSDIEDAIDKRASHNMAERNRRQELTKLFQNVRVKVPALKKHLKASKVDILQGASHYVSSLEENERQKMLEKNRLIAEMENKLALVQSLKMNRGFSS